MTKKIFLACISVCLLLQAHAQRILSKEATISVLTSAPYEGQVFTVYGHVALRLTDPTHHFDKVFNFGLFDDSKPNFIYHFAKGETDYMLGAHDYLSYIVEYQMRGSDITEQVLDLTYEEVSLIWMNLIQNAQPENRVYRYNFFFDNCATRIPLLLENNVNGNILYNDPPPTRTFRDMIDECTRNHPWLTFGCALALGSPTDRMATPHEMMFLPFYLKEAFSKATIQTFGDTERPLVKETHIIKAAETEIEPDILDTLFTPLVCGWILFFVIAALTYLGARKKRAFLGIDIVLFAAAGLGGIVLFFLCFQSEHPSIWPNWSLIWLHPLHLIGLILFCVKRGKKAAYCYHFINFAALSCMLMGWHFIPQQMNAAFIPLVATLWLRSGYGLYRYKRHFE
ncbi:DUF4105 domain-containing protein [Parabacteroides sp. 52]|uniref:lipoprotein N-acyltransferase Lnb domain-containing protein n=1 Tax=unclassified Parabacteroides TaxID=2649774 RepID=UPI0013D5DACA|nr:MULTISPECIES: DUF4105 domain-containing protein [unclassified Parabacteroides]MDH6533969.1 hypothetical protein [Parabacteroides sp. PM5-20]NDV54711.1 DUF4105 domain-containing protein [Parabacteroides sp. 52]